MIFHILFPEITAPTKTGFFGETFELKLSIKVIKLANIGKNLKSLTQIGNIIYQF
jgi:hypothetical protein